MTPQAARANIRSKIDDEVRFIEAAERLITTEGLVFALAISTSKQIGDARILLKQGIIRELRAERDRVKAEVAA